jgi:O-glycosyl hydrolase
VLSEIQMLREDSAVSRRWLPVALVAALPVVALCPGAASAESSQSPGVSVFLTDIRSHTYLSQQPTLAWHDGAAGPVPTITVDTRRRYQTISGFGASLTDSSAWLIGTRLDAGQRDAVMRDLFGADGIGLSFLRQPMGASDFAVNGNYSYDDMPPGQTDPTLAHFSIDHDRGYIIPLLRQARQLNPRLTVMATPWSPPGWMKTSDSMIGGTLKPDASQPLADYFTRFVTDYAAAGVPVDYITPQNEPLYVPGGYPGMYLSAAQQDDLIKNYLGPGLRERGLSTGILGYDHNWDVISYPETMYADPAASGYMAGTAWHCYGGDVVAQSLSHNNYPNEPAFHTECSGGEWEGNDQAGFAGALWLVINTTRNWAKSVVRWNLALDANNGPTNGGCLTCRGVVTVAQDARGNWSYTPTVDYWALGQASRYVRPGARRVASNTFGDGDVKDVAFANPDGSTALVTFNSGTAPRTFRVQWGDKWFGYRLAGGAAATFVWTGVQRGMVNPAAIGSIDIPFDNPDGSRALITYDSGMVAYQAQVRVADQWLGYTLPTGASLRPPTTEVTLPRDGWTVSASASSSNDPPGNAIDGDPATRWSTGHGMQPGDWYQVDLGARRQFNEVVLDTSGSPGDFVRQYQLYVSDDATNWGAPIAIGPGRTVTRILIPPVTGRYIRLVNQGSSGSWWSIHELRVDAPGDPTPVPPASDLGVQRKTATLPDGTQLLVAYNSGSTVATFDVLWGDVTYTYRLPAGAAAIFTTRPS